MIKNLSVITAVRNGADSIERCLNSILPHISAQTELIIIDGASTDDTLERVLRHRERITHLVSEPDQGIADAWNKGLKLATGQVIATLNSDDAWHPEAAARALAAMDPSRPQVCFGDAVMHQADGTGVRTVVGRHDPAGLHAGFGFMHTTCFVTRAAYDLVGPFDLRWRIAIDTDWLLRAMALGVEFVRGGQRVYMQSGGVSERRFVRARAEYVQQLELHAPALAARGIRVRGAMARRTGLWRVKASAVQALGRSWPECIKPRLSFTALALANAMLALATLPMLRRALLRALGNQVGRGTGINGAVRLFTLRRLRIGERCVIGHGVLLDARCGISIGDDVSIAHDARIYTLGHDPDCPYFSAAGAEVRIGDRCVLFAACQVMPGTALGEGCVVLPGAVVSGTFEPFSIIGGVPGRVLRQRSRDLRYRLDFVHPFAP
ncbi:MAG: glycosyltransferase [Planctomycetes bacterium]|nr:glycosyltransferase [Planctomycetota bacterium]